jgi:hypothetical protein
MPSALKLALEDLLRTRKLQAEGPPLRGEDRRLAALRTGLPGLDALLPEGFPRGQLSELHGPASSGRTAVALCWVARAAAQGGLAAWVDPLDRFDPASAEAAGIDLSRLLWLRGPARLPDALSALGTLLGAGLFEALVLDLDGVERRGTPGATWIRLQRLLEGGKAALLLLADTHVACGPGGASLALAPRGARFDGAGAGRLLRGLRLSARAGRSLREADLELPA